MEILILALWMVAMKSLVLAIDVIGLAALAYVGWTLVKWTHEAMTVLVIWVDRSN